MKDFISEKKIWKGQFSRSINKYTFSVPKYIQKKIIILVILASSFTFKSFLIWKIKYIVNSFLSL